MPLIDLDVPDIVKYVLVVSSMFTCALMLIVRLYHQKKKYIEKHKLSVMVLSCIFLAFLHCCAALNIESNWYFGDKRWCELSMKMSVATYTLHRFLLYTFIIIRVEVVNQVNIMSSRNFSIGKVVIGVSGILVATSAIMFTRGISDEEATCRFDTNGSLILIQILIDTSICVTGTWMFTGPVRRSLIESPHGKMRDMLARTRSWSIVCLVSTLLAMSTLVLFSGLGVIISIDCSVTSLALVMMMSPVNSNMISTMNLEFPVIPGCTADELFTVDKPTPPYIRTETEILDDKINDYLASCYSSSNVLG